MDMDIPLPDELELLEADSHAFDDYLDVEPPETDSDNEEKVEKESSERSVPESISPDPSGAAVDLAADHSSVNGRKRLQSDDTHAFMSVVSDNGDISGGKKCRMNEPAAEMEEDWLRYSPPREKNPTLEGGSSLVTAEKTVFRFVSEVDGDFIPITAPDGDERVYAKLGQAESKEQSKKLNLKDCYGGLIQEHIDVLLQRVEQETLSKTLEASSEHQSDVMLPQAQVLHEQLWVDKYAPNSFTELLSDEQTNREVLLWLKQWDSYVFGSEIKSTSDDILSSLRRHSSIAQHHKFSRLSSSRQKKFLRWRDGNYDDSSFLDYENDTTKGIQDVSSKKIRLPSPPEHKILLLCGPPGLGKTTLAHVAAKHCGYHVVEVNASDDRSSSTIESKILDAIQMNSVFGDAKPNCLVIDEIDGALSDGKGAVDVILKLVNMDKKYERDVSKEQPDKESSKKGRKSVSLSRPVICICNDLYAPALRSLRQIAKVHVFVQPTVSRIVSRLKYICNQEGMKTNSMALCALAEYTECDIRSCLNTLQFLYKNKETLNALEIGSQVVGQKDISRNIFDVWKEIFHTRKMKLQRRSDNKFGNMSNKFQFLYSLVSSRGDYELMLDGVHENILKLHYHDPVMQKTVECFDMFGVSDLIQQYIMRTQKMSLYVYQPAGIISVHRLVAQVQRPNIEWPKSYQRCRTMLSEKMDILRSWHCKIPPLIFRHISIKTFVEDLVSPLLHILSPPTLRPVAMHLLSEKEKDDLTQLVSIMVSYTISYKQIESNPHPSSLRLRNEVTLDGAVLGFDPPIDDFIRYEGYKSCHNVLASAMKQLLLHQVENLKILKASNGKSGHLSEAKKENHEVSSSTTCEGKSAKIDSAALSAMNEDKKSHLGLQYVANSISSNSASVEKCAPSVNLKPSGVKKKPSFGPSSFFDRFRKSSNKDSEGGDYAVQKNIILERDMRPLLFKFNEGFTNAIKRPIRVREFLV